MSKKEFIEADYDEISFNSKQGIKRKNSKSLIDDLDEVTSTPLASTIYKKNKEEEKKKLEEEDSSLDIDWEETLASFKSPKIKKSKHAYFEGFDGKKSKKKKKKKDGDLVDHKKDFEPEVALLRNLQIEQTKFVDSLQKKYDQLENTKSTARGVGKYTTDLINSITTARSVAMQLVEKQINVKKTIADLNFKERKEFGSNNNSAQENMSDYASTYLKTMINAGRNNIVNDGAYVESDDSSDNSMDDFFDSITNSLGENNRSDESEKYLKYENSNVKIHVLWNDNFEGADPLDQYDFVAYDQEGKVIDDYPLPKKTKMNVNMATGVATDIFGNKYQLDVL